jgi:hypothetical protein
MSPVEKHKYVVNQNLEHADDITSIQEKFEDPKGVIRSHKSKIPKV